ILSPRTRTNLSTRFDYQLSTNNTLMVRYQFTHNREENNGIGQLALPSQAFNASNNEHSIQVSDTQILSAKAINETRLQWQRETPRQLLIVTGNPLVSNTFVDAGIYSEDDWKIRPNMTLSYGLRFETQNGIHDHGDWAPRISFAWGLGGKKNAAPKTVLRTGMGIFYDRFGEALILQAERLNGINQQQVVIQNPSYPN